MARVGVIVTREDQLLDRLVGAEHALAQRSCHRGVDPLDLDRVRHAPMLRRGRRGQAANVARARGPDVVRVGEEVVFETVVVGTDGSETAMVALAQAIDFVSSGGTLHIVSAYKPSAPRIVEAGGEQWHIMPQDQVDNVLQEAGARGRMAGIKVETHAMKRDPADSIIRVAEEVKADLVVVGNKGMTGAKRFLLGSVPNKVAHNAPCTVLVVKTT